MVSGFWILVGVCGLVLPGVAEAQTFPQESAWVPLPCGTVVMTDKHRDQSGAQDERDIVGDLNAPAGYHFSDASFLYLRMRLDRDPMPNDKPRPFAWGIGVNVDQDKSTYEVLMMVNGNLSVVEVYQNTTTTKPDSPDDPADQPPVASYPISTHGRSLAAAGSSYGGDTDYFLDFAVPWSALSPLGLTPITPIELWAGTSSSANALNGDLACHDGSTGAPTLSGINPDPTVLDPVKDTDNDGWTDKVEVEAGTDPNDASSHPAGPPPPPPGQPMGVDLEGGGGCGGCVVGSSDQAPGCLLVMLLLVILGLVTRHRWPHQ
jgi:hypothetical protein